MENILRDDERTPTSQQAEQNISSDSIRRDGPETPARFRQIGKGFCGSVWAVDRPGPASALKREDGGPGRSVIKDSAMHLCIERSLMQVREISIARMLNIPEQRQLIAGDDKTWWQERAARFPDSYESCNTLITERILPLESSAREKLIDAFCIETSRWAIKNSRKDEDCVVRPYIGRRRANFSCPSQFFTLRNKPLLVNQLEGLGLPIKGYAETMADALAVMYWIAQTDANDVEFVLAPPGPGEPAFQSDFLGEHRMWLLDFDCVNSITMDEQGVNQAARAFFRNNPFYPRPDGENEADDRLWKVFTRRFLQTSALIIGGSKLPQMLIDRLEQLGEERRVLKDQLRASDDTNSPPV